MKNSRFSQQYLRWCHFDIFLHSGLQLSSTWLPFIIDRQGLKLRIFFSLHPTRSTGIEWNFTFLDLAYFCWYSQPVVPLALFGSRIKPVAYIKHYVNQPLAPWPFPCSSSLVFTSDMTHWIAGLCIDPIELCLVRSGWSFLATHSKIKKYVLHSKGPCVGLMLSCCHLEILEFWTWDSIFSFGSDKVCSWSILFRSIYFFPSPPILAHCFTSYLLYIKWSGFYLWQSMSLQQKR